MAAFARGMAEAEARQRDGMTYQSGPCLIDAEGRAWDEQDLERAEIEARYGGRDPLNPWQRCACGDLWLSHDVEEYRGDGSEMCCIPGCSQKGCPGRMP
jgi:hypothetical protein